MGGWQSVAAAKARSIEALRRAAAIVDANADSQEAREFKVWPRSISWKVAATAKEGGFLGIGRRARERGGADRPARDLARPPAAGLITRGDGPQPTTRRSAGRNANGAAFAEREGSARNQGRSQARSSVFSTLP